MSRSPLILRAALNIPVSNTMSTSNGRGVVTWGGMNGRLEGSSHAESEIKQCVVRLEPKDTLEPLKTKLK